MPSTSTAPSANLRLRPGLPIATQGPQATATATMAARPSPAPTATVRPTPAPTPHATETPIAHPAAATTLVYDPPAGVAPFFPSSPFQKNIPNPPTVNANNARWIASAEKSGSFALYPIYTYVSRAPNWTELAFPVFLNHQGSDTPVKLHCVNNYGGPLHPCNFEGMTVYVDPREVPQGGGYDSSPNNDGHWALIDPASGYEYDGYQTRWPPVNGNLTVGWGGRCALAGNGFTNPSYRGAAWDSGCSGDASSTPESMGTVRAKDLLFAAKTGGTLPEALNYAMGCPGRVTALAAPFLSAGDGHCDAAAPEGSHLYLAMHDAQVNALGASPIVAAILRTLDEDHHGAFITDSVGSPSGTIILNIQSDQTYAAFGQGQPWLNEFLPEARREGLPTYSVPSQHRFGVKLPLPASVSWSNLRFL